MGTKRKAGRTKCDCLAELPQLSRSRTQRGVLRQPARRALAALRFASFQSKGSSSKFRAN